MDSSSQHRQLLLWRSLVPYLFLAPALTVLGLTVFWPALQALYLSFTSYGFDVTQPPLWVGLENFQTLVRDRTFWLTVKNTLIYLIGVVPLLAVLPLLLAILVNRNLRGIHWFRVAYYTPVVISMVVAGIAWRWLYAENGLFNQVLIGLGVVDSGIPWLTSPALARVNFANISVVDRGLNGGHPITTGKTSRPVCSIDCEW